MDTQHPFGNTHFPSAVSSSGKDSPIKRKSNSGSGPSFLSFQDAKDHGTLSSSCNNSDGATSDSATLVLNAIQEANKSMQNHTPSNTSPALNLISTLNQISSASAMSKHATSDMLENFLSSGGTGGISGNTETSTTHHYTTTNTSHINNNTAITSEVSFQTKTSSSSSSSGGGERRNTCCLKAEIDIEANGSSVSAGATAMCELSLKKPSHHYPNHHSSREDNSNHQAKMTLSVVSHTDSVPNSSKRNKKRKRPISPVGSSSAAVGGGAANQNPEASQDDVNSPDMSEFDFSPVKANAKLSPSRSQNSTKSATLKRRKCTSGVGNKTGKSPDDEKMRALQNHHDKLAPSDSTHCWNSASTAAKTSPPSTPSPSSKPFRPKNIYSVDLEQSVQKQGSDSLGGKTTDKTNPMLRSKILRQKQSQQLKVIQEQKQQADTSASATNHNNAASDDSTKNAEGQFKLPRCPPVHHNAHEHPVMMYVPKKEYFYLLVKYPFFNSFSPFEQTPLPHTPRMLPFTQLLTQYIKDGDITPSNIKIKSYSITDDISMEIRKFHDSKYLQFLKKESWKEFRYMQIKNTVLRSEESMLATTSNLDTPTTQNTDVNFPFSGSVQNTTSSPAVTSEESNTTLRTSFKSSESIQDTPPNNPISQDSLKTQLHEQLVDKDQNDNQPNSMHPHSYEDTGDEDIFSESSDDSDSDGNSELSDDSEEEDARFGLVSRCSTYSIDSDAPMFPLLWPHIKLIASGTLRATRDLINKEHRIAVHFPGGRHHARKDSAAGYCYVNDVVLASLLLVKRRKRVLVVDIDIHHGDGTQYAFYSSSRVMTMSFHQHGPGLYPTGSGSMEEIGEGKGEGYNINVPLKDGINDENYCELFRVLVTRAVESFTPDYIVLVCGADALSRDRLGVGNLTTRSYEQSCLVLLELMKRYTDMKLLVTGAGGYNLADTVRVWSVVTATLCSGKADSLPEAIPEFHNYQLFEPDFMLHTKEEKVRDRNTPEYLSEIRKHALNLLKK